MNRVGGITPYFREILYAEGPAELVTPSSSPAVSRNSMIIPTSAKRLSHVHLGSPVVFGVAVGLSLSDNPQTQFLRSLALVYSDENLAEWYRFDDDTALQDTSSWHYVVFNLTPNNEVTVPSSGGSYYYTMFGNDFFVNVDEQSRVWVQFVSEVGHVYTPVGSVETQSVTTTWQGYTVSIFGGYITPAYAAQLACVAAQTSISNSSAISQLNTRVTDLEEVVGPTSELNSRFVSI